MKIVSKKNEITFDDVLLLPNLSTFGVDGEQRHISLTTKLTKSLSLDIPIVSAPMPGVTESAMAIALAQAGGMGFIHHFQSFQRQLEQIAQVKKNGLRVAACISDLSNQGVLHVSNLLKYDVNLISIESAHAHNTQIIQFIKTLKRKFNKIQISVSLVVDKNATLDLIHAGVDSIRVGIGGGSHCTTRLVTGIGRPQLSAVAACYQITKKYGIPLISDTGIKYAGDIPKAIAFGADVVMIGGLFSGTDECPGDIVIKEGKKYKYSWGMCTDTAIKQSTPWQTTRSQIKQSIKTMMGISRRIDINQKDFEEGVQGLRPYLGSVLPILKELVSGTRRSMWYQGVTTIGDLRKNARVVLVSSNTMAENVPRI